MWTDDDVLRSLQKYLSLLLEGPPWTIRGERREVRDEARPVAVIQLGEASITRARESLSQGEVEELFPVTVTAYPEVGTDERAARRRAAEVRYLLRRWLLVGLEVSHGGRSYAGPFRAPLYDFSEVPLEGPGRAEVPPPHDVLWIARESVSTSALQDPDDAVRWTVVADFRLTMESPGRVEGEDLPAVTDLRPSYEPG